MPIYNNALTQRPANMLAYQGSIGPVPRNQYLGALADFLAQSYAPERTQQMQGAAQFLSVPAISQTLDRLSYDEPLTTGAGGLGGTTRIRPEALEAGMAVAPLAQPVTMATLQAARAARQAALAGGRAGERYAERMLPGIMERGGLPAQLAVDMTQGTRRQIFVGENSKTWNKANAAKAVELEKAGVAPEDIWSATGTFRGPEGKLRQEISDQASKMTQVAKDKIEANQYFSGPMGQAFENEPLFNAYPKLHWMDTFVNKELRGGTFNPERQEINIMMPTEGGQRSVALHELQHAVQQKEGFARGGSPKDIGDLKGDLIGMEDKYNFLASEYFTATNDVVKSNILQELDYLKPRIEALQKFKNIDPEEGYMRLAGEAEARAVQNRMDMSDVQRRVIYPYESYDRPVNQLIVRNK